MLSVFPWSLTFITLLEESINADNDAKPLKQTSEPDRDRNNVSRRLGRLFPQTIQSIMMMTQMVMVMRMIIVVVTI